MLVLMLVLVSLLLCTRTRIAHLQSERQCEAFEDPVGVMKTRATGSVLVRARTRIAPRSLVAVRARTRIAHLQSERPARWF
jgi:hypothetical protein